MDYKSFSEFINNPTVVSAIVTIGFSGFAIFKYLRKVYYSFNGIDASNHILNKRFALNRMTDIVDENKINRQMFYLDLASIFIGSLIMFFVDAIWGMLILIVLSKISSIAWSAYIGPKYLKIRNETPKIHTLDRKERRKLEKENRKK